MTTLPALHDLHQRHPGLTPLLCGSYAEAASVCLSRHHASPVEFDVVKQGIATSRQVAWVTPDDRVKRAWNNNDDATRDGAYSLSIAAVEVELGLLAVQRAETRTGADYYMAPTPAKSLETAYRLEVSGVDHGNEKTIQRRLIEKVQQARRGSSNLPAIAAVVGFLERRIEIEQVT